MNGLVPTLLALALAGNGIAAGVMLSTVIGIVPLVLVLPYERYVNTIQFMWPRYDPFMPITHAVTVVLDIVLFVVVDVPAARLLFGAAAVVLTVVMVISLVKNVPMNRYVMSLDPNRQPADWSRTDPRPSWRNWNLLRTTLAVVALAGNAAAAAALA
ncbi:DUF1772 domain-containing protein [Paractinoplanes ferrugineus]|uniref:DUF1772 domain-containing protein n=1 Tax=Paractinoplanes ferrugineus TaxID=113564 RepID=A0A919J5I1_9ACTN|nr:DUF1772 domain-containing protein [Actinoplanes ferrugineus]GIE13722.1 hypothetical protein Afe05nite_55620 [Actinoplanes ferrugineus]